MPTLHLDTLFMGIIAATLKKYSAFASSSAPSTHLLSHKCKQCKHSSVTAY